MIYPTMEQPSVQAKRTHPRVQHVFPADNWYFWLKAAEDRPDEIITDLEDAVATPRKALARDIFIAILKLFRGEPPIEAEMAALRQANSPEGRGPHLPVFLARMKAVKGLPLTAAEQETLEAAEASPDKKIQALLAQVARCHGLDGIIVTLRVNNLHTKWSAGDLWHVVRAMGNRVDRILLPKVEGPEDMILLHRILTAIEAEQGWEQNGIQTEALIELPSAVRQLDAICRCTPRMVCSIFGIVDWTAATGGRDQDHQQAYALYGRLRTVEVSVAAGLEAIDGITPSLQRHRSFVDAGKAARLGFTGKWSVNPNNLAGIMDFIEGRRPDRRDPRARPASIGSGSYAEVRPRTVTSPEYPPYPIADLERFAREKRPLLPPRVLELRDATVRRSVLPVSAAQPEEIEAALASSADEVIVDLAPIAGRTESPARAQLVDTLRGARGEQTLLTLQANPGDGEAWQAFEEVVTALGSWVAACALPQAASPSEVRGLDARLTEIETRFGLPIGHVRIEGRIRTEAALDQAYEIATASRRVSALIFDIPIAELFRRGHLAVASKTRSLRKAEYLLKGQLLVATSEAGVDAVDSLTRTGSRVSREALDAANHGFSGKLARLDEVEEINARLVPPRAFIQELAPVIQGVAPPSIREALSPGAIRAILRKSFPAEWVEPFIRTCRELAEPYWNAARRMEEFPAALRAELQRRWYPASIERALQPFELFAVADQDRGLGAVAYSDPWRANAIELVDAATARVYEHILRTAWKAGLLTPEEDRRYHRAFERLRTALLVREAAGLMPGMRIPGYAVSVEDWMVKLFAHTSGDRNLYHLDEEFVAQERARGVVKFDGRIAHGVLTLLVSLVGLHRVADGCGIHSIEEVRYKAPVRIGDSVTPIFTVVDARDSRIRLRVEALRRDGQVAMEGTVVVIRRALPPSPDGPRPPDPARRQEAKQRSAAVAPFPRDRQAPVFAQGTIASRDFQATVSPEVADGYWGLVGSADPALWNLAVSLGMVAHTSANFASPGWILLSTKLEEQQAPIREGDTLTSKATLSITRLTREEKRPICRIAMEVRNQHDRPVLRAEVTKLGDPGLCRDTP